MWRVAALMAGLVAGAGARCKRSHPLDETAATISLSSQTTAWMPPMVASGRISPTASSTWIWSVEILPERFLMSSKRTE